MISGLERVKIIPAVHGYGRVNDGIVIIISVAHPTGPCGPPGVVKSG